MMNMETKRKKRTEKPCIKKMVITEEEALKLVHLIEHYCLPTPELVRFLIRREYKSVTATK